MTTLDDLARKYGTDKSSDCHDYCQYYDRHLYSRRDKMRRVLELGVWEGASLLMWREYFPNALIAGIDLDLSRVPDRVRAMDRLLFAQGDLNDTRALARLVKAGPWDLIVDDASHVIVDQQRAFLRLWPHVAARGLYVIEDTCCAYWPEYQQGQSMERWLLRYVDAVNLHGARAHGFARKFETVNEANALSDEEQSIEALHVYNSLLMFEKRR